MQKFLFLTTAHQYDDDRIFHHQAKELSRIGKTVKICSLSSDFQGFVGGVSIEAFACLTKPTHEKLAIMLAVCKDFQPDVIICSEPLAVIAASRFKKIKKTHIIYDVTEWYPSFRMLAPYSFLSKIFHFFKFNFIQIYAGFCCDKMIFGEVSKMFPVGYLFPFKPKLLLPYYPDFSFIQKNVKNLTPEKITLCYTGRMSEEDGIGNFFNALQLLRKRNPNLQISVLIIGSPKREKDVAYFNSLLSSVDNLDINLQKPVPFEDFSAALADADICLDLREKNWEYNQSLPIKLFYYIASGKPIIYTNLSAISKHLDVSNFGDLVFPNDTEKIVSIIEHYIQNPSLYNQRAMAARQAFEEKYNWGKIKNQFTEFVTPTS